MVMVAPPARTRVGSVVDQALVLLAGLSGPFALLLALPAAMLAWSRRTPAQVSMMVVTWASAVIEGAVLLASGHTGPPAGPGLFTLARSTVHVLAERVVLMPIIGRPAAAQLPALGHLGTAVDYLAVATALAAGFFAIRRAPLEFQVGVLFGALAFAAAVLRLGSTLNVTTSPAFGSRYFFLPMLAWLGILFRLAMTQQAPGRRLALAALMVGLVVAVPMSWEYPPLPRSGFYAAVDRFDQAPPGTTVVFPENPPGWGFALVKR